MLIDRRTFTACALTAIALPGAASAATRTPEAMTQTGRVRGFARNGAEVFLGIPYGADTSGARRFLPPAAPPSWPDVRDATRLGQRAPQQGEPIYKDPVIGEYMAGGRARELVAMKEPMGEDCLVLNVLTPRVDNKGRPVLVYLHGGGFASGSGAVHTLGDRFVAQEDTVLVTVNHRLGMLGYQYFGGISDRYVLGNPGLLDLVAALRWVRDNIAEFGGDPNKVTIFGESGGGAKVSYMLAMPEARGLFRAAIIQSAGLVKPASRSDADHSSRKLLQELSLAPAQIDQLHQLPLDRLMVGGDFARLDAMRPVLDNRTVTLGPWDGGVIAQSPGIPLIIGYCADEISFFRSQDRSLFSLDWTSMPSRLAEATGKSAVELEPAIAAYREVYPSANASDLYFRMASISFLGWNAKAMLDQMAGRQAPSFYYRMEYDTGLPPGIRAFHTCELPLANRMVLQPRADRLSKQLAGAWAAFARTGGNPNHPGLPHWAPYRPDGAGPVMLFDLAARAGPDPEARAQGKLRSILGAGSFV